jgi:hypothetical protein
MNKLFYFGFSAEIETKTNDKRTKKSDTPNASPSYDNDGEEDNELSPRLSK